MERTFVVIDEKTLECAVPVELNNTQEAIMECEELRDQIDQIAKNLHVCWDVKKLGNKSYAIISKVIDVVSLDKSAHEVEIKAINFMSAIGGLTLPSFEHNCPNHEPANEEADVIAERLKFCKEIREDMDDVDNIHIVAADLVIGHGDLMYSSIRAGNIDTPLLKELLDLYIEKYDHE